MTANGWRRDRFCMLQRPQSWPFWGLWALFGARILVFAALLGRRRDMRSKLGGRFEVGQMLYDADDVKEKLKTALDKLYRMDGSLLAWHCSERAIVFRLSMYLAQVFEAEGLDVDCEYNRSRKSLKSLRGRACNFPDVIVHRRGTNDNNVLVVEVKTAFHVKDEGLERDACKLRGFTCEPPYFYRHGAHAYLAAVGCGIAWYAEGAVRQYCQYRINPHTHALVPVGADAFQVNGAFDRLYAKASRG